MSIHVSANDELVEEDGRESWEILPETPIVFLVRNDRFDLFPPIGLAVDCG